MKPHTYDGTSAIESFYAQFLNCSDYHQWTKTDQLAYLKGALQEAGQVLWDYGPEVTDSFIELVKTLKGRFGGANQSDKFRMEICNRRRKDGESLQSLHSDVRRLAALAFPDLQHSARERITCDYFIDALADADFALKVRELAPTNLDSALRTAFQLEVWSEQVDRTTQHKKIREVTKADDETTALKKQVADLQKQLADNRRDEPALEGLYRRKETLHVLTVETLTMPTSIIHTRRLQPRQCRRMSWSRLNQ